MQTQEKEQHRLQEEVEEKNDIISGMMNGLGSRDMHQHQKLSASL